MLITNFTGRSSLAVLTLGMAWLLCAATAAQMQEYDGAARIGNLDRVTVVYPKASGEQGEINRDSADLRAAYLLERYGVITEIAADDAVTDAQLNGHLLLLGWDNALLGTPAAPLPFTRTDTGFIFSGAAGLEGDDLLFMTVSPYNSNKYLTFWSRINPEMDRDLTFPFVGSDWVIYRDHLHVRQGMLHQVAEWPPRRDENAEHENNYRTPRAAQRSAHYTVHYSGAVLTEETAPAVLAAREQALEKAAALMEVAIPDGFEIDLFVYRDQQHKHRETAVADPVHSLTQRGELYMPRAQAKRPVPHEEIHLLAASVYGECSLSAMHEGLAFASESRDDELAAFAGIMVERDAVPDLALMFDDEKMRKLAARGQAFVAAGLMMHWVKTLAGQKGLKQAYSLRRGNALAGLARITGNTPDTVNRAFADWVRELAAGSKRDLEYRKALGEAHQRGKVGDFSGRAEALVRALAVKSEDPQIHYQLALAYIEDGQYEQARATLTSLLDRPASIEGSYVAVFSQYLLGKVHSLTGRPEAARVAYERVLAQPDQHGSHKLAQDALSSLDSPER